MAETTLLRERSVVSMNYRILGAIAAAVLAACPAVSVANGFHLFGGHGRQQQQAVRVSGPQPAPYHWTQGAAPKAHREMVAEKLYGVTKIGTRVVIEG